MGLLNVFLCVYVNTLPFLKIYLLIVNIWYVHASRRYIAVTIDGASYDVDVEGTPED